MPKIFYLACDVVGLHADGLEGDGGVALGDGLVRARDGDHLEGVVLVLALHGSPPSSR